MNTPQAFIRATKRLKISKKELKNRYCSGLSRGVSIFEKGGKKKLIKTIENRCVGGIEMNKILLAGGAGYIGSHTAVLFCLVMDLKIK